MATKIEKLVADYDHQNFLRWLEEFPDQVEKACRLGQNINEAPAPPAGLVVGGMGGSGISGDLVASYCRNDAEIPVYTVRDYNLPAWVDSSFLFTAVSYSGNTEETLSLYQQAVERGCGLLVVSGGGQLIDRADEAGHPVIKIPSGQPPRASAPYLFIPLLYLLDKMGCCHGPSENDLGETLKHLGNIVEELAPGKEANFAFELVRKVYDKIPVIYGSAGMTGTLALRLKNQFNENAKMIALANELPELNHNEIMGWQQMAESPENYIALFLRDSGEHERIKKRFSISGEILSSSVAGIETMRSRGDSLFCRMMTLMLISDYTSYYAALLRHKDPSAIENIEALKKKL
ncbi:MAG: bifunctional phosphoglucose/phosphomannose isomerase [bacterium]